MSLPANLPIGAAGRPGALQALVALSKSETPSIREVAQEFEALLVGELTRQAGNPLPGTQPLDGGSAGRMYREQFFQEVSRLAAERGGFGIAEAIERQLSSAASEADGESS